MPILATLYALLLSWSAIESVREQVKRKEPAWYTALDLTADITRLMLFVSYWVNGLFSLISPAAPYLFLLTWVWSFAWAGYELRQGFQQVQSEEERQLFKRFGFAVGALLVLPAFWFGALVTLRALR
jgi:hypothetical protein